MQFSYYIGSVRRSPFFIRKDINRTNFDINTKRFISTETDCRLSCNYRQNERSVYAGIAVTQETILRFFDRQRRHIAPMGPNVAWKVDSSTSNLSPLLHGLVCGPQNWKFYPISEC